MYEDKMLPKNRVLAVLNRKKLDRVPLNFNYCGMEEVNERLKKDLQLKDFEELQKYFRIDFRQTRVSFTKRNLENNMGWEDVLGIVRTKVVTKTSTFWEVETAPFKTLLLLRRYLTMIDRTQQKLIIQSLQTKWSDIRSMQ